MDIDGGIFVALLVQLFHKEVGIASLHLTGHHDAVGGGIGLLHLGLLHFGLLHFGLLGFSRLGGRGRLGSLQGNSRSFLGLDSYLYRLGGRGDIGVLGQQPLQDVVLQLGHGLSVQVAIGYWRHHEEECHHGSCHGNGIANP